MYRLTLSEKMLSNEERSCFAPFLREHAVDTEIWDVYAASLRVSSPKTQPLLLRAYCADQLAGAAFVARCSACGKSLFSNPLLHMPFDFLGLPAFIWIRVGFCAETLANPGFIAPGFEHDDVLRAMLGHLIRKSCGVMVMDGAENIRLHAGGNSFPYVSDGIVDVQGMTSESDYVAQHRNIKRKIKEFVNKGGIIDVQRGPASHSLQQAIDHCIAATAAKSLIYSPFQDIFPDAVRQTCRIDSQNLVHFVARMHGEFLGYHTFLETGDGLRMLHGAFDRDRPTTFHAYENLIIDTVRYAIEHALERIYFGPVMNETKRRMMNVSRKSIMAFHSSTPLIKTFIPMVFPYTRTQRRELLAFAE